MSFRSTTNAVSHTKRGFIIEVDRKGKKVKFVFDYQKISMDDPLLKEWIETIKKEVGLKPLNPEPYWGFEDLRYAIGEKIKNCFYVIADTKIDNKHEFFKYIHMG